MFGNLFIEFFIRFLLIGSLRYCQFIQNRLFICLCVSQVSINIYSLFSGSSFLQCNSVYCCTGFNIRSNSYHFVLILFLLHILLEELPNWWHVLYSLIKVVTIIIIVTMVTCNLSIFMMIIVSSLIFLYCFLFYFCIICGGFYSWKF